MEELQIPQETFDLVKTAQAIAYQDCEQGYCSVRESYIEKRATNLSYYYCPSSKNFNAEDRRAFVDIYCDTIKELKVTSKYDSVDYSLMKQLLQLFFGDEGDYYRELLRDLYQLEQDKEYQRLSGQYHPMYHKFYESLIKKDFTTGTLDEVIEHYHRLIDKEAHALIDGVMPGPVE